MALLTRFDRHAGHDHTDDAGHQAPGAVPKTRASTTWVALAGALLALIVVLVFILQNLRSVSVHFFTAEWRIPFGIDLLFAVILGGLIVLGAGSLRILQLRRLAGKRGRTAEHHRHEAELNRHGAEFSRHEETHEETDAATLPPAAPIEVTPPSV